MNKAIKAVAMAICALIVIVMGVYGIHESHTEKTYGVDATVTAIDDAIHVVDTDGMAYSFYGEGYQVNQAVRLIMSNDCTPDRFDDSVIGAVTL